MGSLYSAATSPDGGIGRRGGFKIRFRKEWEFESPSGHHIAVSESLYQTPSTRETGHLSRFFCAYLSIRCGNKALTRTRKLAWFSLPPVAATKLKPRRMHSPSLRLMLTGWLLKSAVYVSASKRKRIAPIKRDAVRTCTSQLPLTLIQSRRVPIRINCSWERGYVRSRMRCRTP